MYRFAIVTQVDTSVILLYKVKDIHEDITFSSRKSMTSTKFGILKCRLQQINGSILDATLNEVNYVPEFQVNLLRINKALKNGFNLRNKGVSLCLTKGPVSVSCQRELSKTNSFVSGIKMSVIHPLIITNAIKTFVT